MSASSISYTSSSSGSDSLARSGSVTPSTPSECVSSKLYLLPPTFIDPCQLEVFAATLDKGYGDKMVLAVAHTAQFDVDNVEKALLRLGEAVPDVCFVNKQWVKVPEGKDGAFFLVDSANGSLDQASSVEAFVKLHDGNVVLTTPAKAQSIFSLSGLRVIFSVSFSTDTTSPTPGGNHATLYLLERPQITFPPLPLRAPFGFGVPTLEEWHTLWAAWDLVTLQMIPKEMLHQKPIDLRHQCLFYIGHIPTFLDMLMSKALHEPNTEPKQFTLIFERGIDPHVDHPEQCHRHSEVPTKVEDWPTLGNILAFRDRVRARLVKLYDDVVAGRRVMDRHVGRMLAMTHEHEGWHVETLLYMLIQRAGTGTLPPPGFMPPPWDTLAAIWDCAPVPHAPTVTLGPANVALGLDDCEADDFVPEVMHDVAEHSFGWDNESPVRQVQVEQVRVSWRPVTNGEYLAFLKSGGGETQSEALPGSWMLGNDGEIRVRTLYGPVPMPIAQHWPVLTSYDGLLAYARSKGGRLPTEPELRLFLDMYDVGHTGGANVGYRHWHPVPATTGFDDAGRGTNGGVWEWTSTRLATHAGMVPTAHFVGYTTDFCDGRHQVVLGASYATIPRLTRRTVRNFWQRGYPYAWVGGRVVYDV